MNCSYKRKKKQEAELSGSKTHFHINHTKCHTQNTEKQKYAKRDFTKHQHLLLHPNGPTRKLKKNVQVQVHRRTTNCPPTAFLSTILAMQQRPLRMFILWLIQVLSCQKDICQVVTKFSILQPLQRDWIGCYLSMDHPQWKCTSLNIQRMLMHLHSKSVLKW